MLKILMLFSFFLIFGNSFAKAQEFNLCDCWVAKADQKKNKPKSCKPREELTEEETLKIMECLLDQKGNKTNHVGVILNNNVSQDYGSSPTEVVALYYVSYLYKEGEHFANAMVLLYDYNDEEPNSKKAISKAHKAYKKWYEKVEEIGLEKARKQKLDPLEGTSVSWY